MRPTVHIVPHTHWDREWYHSAARFQVRLARLVDDVLDQLDRRRLPAFLLDGQGIVLDDFVALRPGAAAQLGRQLAAGRLECGPWYVLADNLTVSAEALVRNLMEGGRAVRRHGGSPMAVGYAPDAFGHPAILPTLFAGFGIRAALTWRGFGGERGQDKDLYRWRGPDGAEVLMIHLPPPGYEYGANLPADPAGARTRWRDLKAMLGPRARSPHWLVLNGADHHAAQPDLMEAFKALKRTAPDCAFAITSLATYAQAVQTWARLHRDEVPELRGELRAGRRHAWALQGTFSSRITLKQQNAACQRMLERIAEPLSALALRASETAMALDLRADLQAAWRTLLENHPHDSICGTSTDAVHAEMVTRFARCREQADEIAQRALDAVIGHDADEGRTASRAARRPAVLIFNPAPRVRSGVVEFDVARFVAEVPVGPGSARRRGTPAASLAPLALRDARGKAVAFQTLGAAERATVLVESPRHYPDCDVVELQRVAILARDLPPLGVRALAVGNAKGAPRAPTGPVKVSAGELANEHVRVRLESDGTIAMARIGGGWNAHGLGRLELMRDDGDAYTSAPRGKDLLGAPGVAAAVAAAGPLVGELEVHLEYPAAAKSWYWGLHEPVAVRVHAGERLLRLTIPRSFLWSGQRLRLAFPLGEKVRRVVADGPFGPVERGVGRARAARTGETEATPATAPMQRYVSVAGARTGMTVFADGLPEYEVRAGGTVLITLERAFGEVSRNDLPERPGHASWPSQTLTSGASGQFRLAVMLHDPAALDDGAEIEAAAEAFLAPPVGFMRQALLGLPGDVRGPELVGEGLVFSACKPAESGKGIVLRCYNPGAEARRGEWVVPGKVASAKLCRLDETGLSGASGAATGHVTCEVQARGVATLNVERLTA